MFKRTYLVLVVFSLLSPALRGQEQAQGAAKPASASLAAPAFGEKLHVNGIPNAGKLNEVFYRGAQPKRAGLAELKKLGITTIVDLRGEDENRIA